MTKNIKNIAVLVCICVVITSLLAVTNTITAPIIEKNKSATANAALLKVMPNGAGFELVDISKHNLPSTVTEVYKETSDLGYVVKIVTNGYASDMVIMCGVSNDKVVTGAVCLSSNETLGKEKTYGENFTNKDANGVDAVDTIASVTKTTAAYKNAVKDALNTATIMSGGTVDIRNEEEVLADNLAAALPSADKFTKLFLVEVVDGIDAIYSADNKTGYVCVVGDQFIGVDANGTVLTDTVENPDNITNAIDKVKSTTYKEIDLSSYPDLASYVLSARKTTTGNYVVETKGAGYGIKGGNEYHPASNEYIIVRVSMTNDNKIIDCLTVSQAETKGIGDVCANESFYKQFVGKTQTDYNDVDAISGATMTTDGYKQAVKRAFDTVNALKGGGNNE